MCHQIRTGDRGVWFLVGIVIEILLLRPCLGNHDIDAGGPSSGLLLQQSGVSPGWSPDLWSHQPNIL